MRLAGAHERWCPRVTGFHRLCVTLIVLNHDAAVHREGQDRGSWNLLPVTLLLVDLDFGYAALLCTLVA
jgi:hypothetical protein